ncbi:DUF4153 domain-containing protein [Nocardia neocaledoniensis]|uniref:DUF4153 domain-containing protein n=1 Tax=Nocardia neocaledoniensis TaxID=236511 RepID=UPI002458B4AF|nr:DUF4153 domain-containing protein [Nocardia neocaledoniensis]
MAHPPRAVPAAALAGIFSATVVPVDRPGLGWLLAGTVVAGTLYAVDRHARTRPTEPKSTPAAKHPATPAPITGSPQLAADGEPGTRQVADTKPAADANSAQSATAGAPTDAAGASSAAETDRGATTDGSAGAAADADRDAGAHGSSAAADEAPADRASTGSSTAAAKNMRDNGSPANDPNGRAEVSTRSESGTPSSGSGNAEGQVGRGDAAGASSPAPKDAPTTVSGGAGLVRLPGSARVWWAAAALVLLGVGVVRAAGWLFVLCVVAACVAGSLAVLGRRTRWGVVHDMVAVPLATLDALPWAWSGLREARPTGASSVRRYGVSVAATAALLVVFVPLLGGADATFADLLSGLVPAVDGASAWEWILMFGVVGIGALAALYLLAGPPAAAEEGRRPVRQWSRSEWVLPVSALTVLFGVFVGAQFVALFGGDDYVQRTAGLTYAEYARSGFWQLSAVSILTLAVILAVLHWSVQASAADRRWLRVLLTAVSVLSLVIVGSALARMWTYQQAYGFTVLRVLVGVCELWVGLVYLLVLVAIALLRWNWVSRAAVGTALGTLITLSALNPEYLVADRNIDRWEQGKRLDTEYLSTLSPDVIPALTHLPDPLRTKIEGPILTDLDDDSWWSWNWSRDSAR